MAITKILGLVDILAAIIIFGVDVPIIGKLKYVIILILLVKGVPSLFG